MSTDIVSDLRVDLILRVESDHAIRYVSSKDAPKGESWRCSCGVSYKGDGAIKKGRRHTAAEILSGLEQAGVIA